MNQLRPTDTDCDTNGVPDRCSGDCNTNGIWDACEVFFGSAADCNTDGVPDECSKDCNTNGVFDACDIFNSTEADCNSNGVPDSCEDWDCQPNGLLDVCEIFAGSAADCDTDGVLDVCEISADSGLDCEGFPNGILDSCEPDCDTDGVPDTCALELGAADCNSNGVPDGCDPDCDNNGYVDDCDIVVGTNQDCNANGVPDVCDVVSPLADCNADGIPDDCSGDCDGDGVTNAAEICAGTATDCDGDLIPDDCELSGCLVFDCNGNGVPDNCDIAGPTSQDTDSDGVPDECIDPPLIESIRSVGYHGAAGNWPGGEVELCIDPQVGGIEPRLQLAKFAGVTKPTFLRVTFDRAIDGSRLAGNIRLVPAVEDVYPVGTLVGTNGTVEIDFYESDLTTPAEVPGGSYRIDMTGVKSLAGGRIEGACASFPMCWATGDVNCDGRTVRDIDLVPLIHYDGMNLSEVPLKRADIDRNGIVSAGYLGDDFWLRTIYKDRPDPNAVCGCCGNFCASITLFGENDCNTNGFGDLCDVLGGTAWDCNLNLEPDECEPPDWLGTNGIVNLYDFAGFQGCFGDDLYESSLAMTPCIATFDRADCSKVDLADLEVFREWLNDSSIAPPPGQTQMMSGGGSVGSTGGIQLVPGTTGEIDGPVSLDGQANGPTLQSSPNDWTVLEYAVALKVRELGGTDPVTTLEPFTTYELHYVAEYDEVNLYLLDIIADSASAGATNIAAPVLGDWAGTGRFEYGDTHTQSAWAFDDVGADPGNAASEAGHLCTFTTGAAGGFSLSAYMDCVLYLDQQVMITMVGELELQVE